MQEEEKQFDVPLSVQETKVNQPIDVVFVCEKETNKVIVYNLVNNCYEKRDCDVKLDFGRNFAYCQTTQQRLFLVGGGDVKQPELPSLVSTFEIIYTENGPLKTVRKSSLQFPRHGHSLTCISDKLLIATGSALEKAAKSCEFYNIELDTWFNQPSLNKGRHYHSSCVFNDQWIYVFAGVESTTKKYTNSIERFNYAQTVSNETKWELILDINPAFTIRQGLGSVQVSAQEILLFGGFSGEFLDDVFTLKHTDTTIVRHEKDVPNKMFLFQMPVLFDVTKAKLIAVDWKSKKALAWNKKTNWQILKELL